MDTGPHVPRGGLSARMPALNFGEPRLKRWNTVAIVGVGLIGGSIGLALRRRGLAENVVGIGRRAVSLDMAHRVGAVTQSTQDLKSGLVGAELVVVCTPVAQIVDQVR